jgi:CRISPR-associated protein Cmr5
MSDASARRSLEQRRAQAAWETVQKVDQNKGKEFKSVATSLPADIQANGFGQTMAFLRAKGKDEHNITFDAVADWVRQRLNITNEDFMSWLMTKATTEQYRQATAEAIAFAIWMKRFAEARFKS